MGRTVRCFIVGSTAEVVRELVLLLQQKGHYVLGTLIGTTLQWADEPRGRTEISPEDAKRILRWRWKEIDLAFVFIHEVEARHTLVELFLDSGTMVVGTSFGGSEVAQTIADAKSETLAQAMLRASERLLEAWGNGHGHEVVYIPGL